MTIPRDEQARRNGGSDPLSEEFRRGRDEARALGVEAGAIIAEFRELGMREAELAQAEVQENLQRAMRGAVFGAVGGVFLVLALGFGSLAAVFALALTLEPWAAALIVAGALLLLAVILLLVARSQIARFSPTPKRTLESIREDVRWAREQMKRNGA